MKNILFIIPSIWTAGTNSALTSLLSNLPKDRFDVKVFSLTIYGERKLSYSEQLLPKHRILSAYYSSYKDTRGLKRISGIMIRMIKKICGVLNIPLQEAIHNMSARWLSDNYNFDTVVGFMEGPATEVASLVRARNKVAWIHCNYNMYLPLSQSEEHIYSLFNTIVNVSEFTTSVFRERYPLLALKTKCIYNLVDEKRILANSEETLLDPVFDTSLFTIISVGRISPVKRFSKIPEIVKEILDKGHIVMWYIIGPEQDSRETALLKTNIQKFGVDTNVKCLGMKQNPYPYFKKANLYVCLSESEACPMVFIEARIIGLPILSADFPSAKEFINNGQNGILSSISEMPNEIMKLIEDKSILMSLTNSNIKEQNILNLEKIINVL